MKEICMLDKDQIRRMQIMEKKRALGVSVIASCCIKSARATSCMRNDGKLSMFDILVESGAGTWRIRRTRDEICNFHKELDIMFPVEAGKKGHKRTLPNLELGRIGVRMFTTKVKRREQEMLAFSKYAKSLLFLPPYISRSRHVLEFFLAWSERDEPMIKNSSFSNQSRSSKASDTPSCTAISLKSISSMGHRMGRRIKGVAESEIVAVDYYEGLDKRSLMIELLKKLNVKNDVARHLKCKDEHGDLIDIVDDEDFTAALLIGVSKFYLT